MPVDLRAVEARLAAERAQREREAEDAALATVALWDKAMTRAFKGIMPRPTRRSFLMRATEAADA